MQKIRIGLFGGAGIESEENLALAHDVGAYVAACGAILVTGATTGIPYAGAKAAFSAGGMVIGISPARDQIEHVERYGKPLDGCSFIVWTGSGYTLLLLRNSRKFADKSDTSNCIS